MSSTFKKRIQPILFLLEEFADGQRDERALYEAVGRFKALREELGSKYPTEMHELGG